MNHEVAVHEMLPEEEGTVRQFLERNLNAIDGLFFGLAFGDALKSARKQLGTSLVAMYEGRIVGSFSLRIVVYGEKRIGLIDAIVTERGLRGKGIGRSLLDEALVWFEKKRCEVIYATVDRFNSSSWNLFTHGGFTPLEFRGQVRDLGLNLIRLWFTEFYIVGGGTFFLKKAIEKDGPSKEASERWHFLAAWLGFAFALWMAFRLGISFNAQIVFGVAGSTLLIHESAHKFVAWRFGLRTTFKAWDSGMLFGWFLAILGAVYPSYGSTYVRQVDWRYDAKQKGIGLIYAAGPAASLIFAVVLRASSFYFDGGLLSTIGRMGYVANYVLALFNLIPIRAAGGFAWDGARIYFWNRGVWTLLVVVLASLIMADIIF